MKITVALTVMLSALAASAQAQKITPGLWEHSMLMKPGAGGQMDAAMARMSPEQRKQMEAMMASRGMAMGGGGKPTTVKACVTPEQAAREEMPQHDGNCKQTSKHRSGNTVRVTFECTGERQAKGEGEFTLISDKEHKGHMTVDALVKGKPERMEMDYTGRWLAADCGDIKPRK